MEKDLKTQKRKVRKQILQLISVIALCFSAFLLYNVVLEVSETYRLQNNLELVQIELDEINDQNRKLSSQVDKLENPDYVQNYARGKYMLSKQGESIFYLPSELDKNNIEDNVEEEIDKTINETITESVTTSESTTDDATSASNTNSTTEESNDE